MPIQFIDNASIDKKRTRTLIRSHAAKGKNLGRTVSRVSRYPRKPPPAVACISPSGKPSPGKKPEAHTCRDHEASSAIERQPQGDWTIFVPFGVSPTSRRLFHEFVNFANAIPYPLELKNTVIQGRGPRMFLQYAFIDEAFFHSVVAMSVTTAASLSVTRTDVPEAFHHLSHSLRIVHQRLAGSGAPAISDATLAVVVVLTQQERLLGYDDAALVHFEGLQKIIALKGGIAALVSRCQVVAQKALRADFDFALQFGSPTKFATEVIPGQTTLHWLREEFGRRRAVSLTDDRPPAFVANVNGELRSVFEDLSAISWFFNESAVHGLTIDDYDFHNVLLIMGYRLLNMHPLDSPPAATVDELEVLLHLGLVALINMFFLTVGLKCNTSLLNHRIVTATLEQRCRYRDREGRELLLWLLFIGKASVFRTTDEDIWLVPRVSEVAAELGVTDWDQLSRTLRRFPWACAFADEAAQTLWTQASSFAPSPVVS